VRNRHRVFAVVFGSVCLAAALGLSGCQQVTSDPDQPLRDTIVGRSWLPDTAYTTDVVSPKITFYAGGKLIIDDYSSTTYPTYGWSYLKSVFTITGPLGTYTTTSPSFDSTHFAFQYGPSTAAPQLVHLAR